MRNAEFGIKFVARAGDRRSPLQLHSQVWRRCKWQNHSLSQPQAAASYPQPQSARASSLVSVDSLSSLFVATGDARIAHLGEGAFWRAKPNSPCVAARPYSRRDPCSETTQHRHPRMGFERVSDASAASGGSSELSESTETSNRAAARVRRLRLRIEDPSWGSLRGKAP